MHKIRNIVFIISEIGGGVTRYSINHASKLIKSGYKVYLANNGSKSNFISEEIEGILCLNIKLNLESFEAKLFEIGINQDHTSFICTEAFELDFFYLNKLKFHIVFVAHGDYPYYINSAVKYIGIIDSVACVSNSIYRKLMTHKLIYRKKKIYYVPHNLEKYQETNNQKEKHSIAFIGRPTKEKGYSYLINLINNLEAENIYFNWHFFGFERPLDFSSKSSSQRIEFHGELNHNDLLMQLDKCQYLILPSTHEGLPLSVLEALNCSLIPICNLFNKEITEIIHHNKNGFIVKDNNLNEYKNILKKLFKTGLVAPKEFNKKILENYYSASFGQIINKKYKPKYLKGFQSQLLKLTSRL
jgi:glycosyltransferase involved in cell wall biosynthesis